MKTKTGIMLGLGETFEEVVSLMEDSRAHGVNIFTAGQYLQPSRDHLPVVEYVPLDSFAEYEQRARAVGFENVFIGPLVRSSYHAGEFASDSASETANAEQVDVSPPQSMRTPS